MEISMNTNDDDEKELEVTRSTRVEAPAHYTLKIESFSLLSKSGIEYFESDVFQACGFKWKLHLYPEGDLEEDGADHISLNLEIDDSSSLLIGCNVHVCAKFFVYDHIRNNYLTVQVSGIVSDGIWEEFPITNNLGLSKLLSLDCFMDSSNGYLCNDSCVFGAEVFVTPRCAERETCFTMIEPPSKNNTYSWTIENFLTVKDKKLRSKEFEIGNVKWKMLLSRKGNGLIDRGGDISIDLAVSDCSCFPRGWRFYSKYKIRVKDQVGDDHIEDEVNATFNSSSPS